MSAFPWLPVGTRLPDGAALSRLSATGTGWQLCATQAGGRSALLLRPEATGWPRTEADELLAALDRPPASVDGMLCIMLPADTHPTTVHGLGLRNPALGRQDAEHLGHALAALRERNPQAAWGSALFLPAQRLALAGELDGAEDRLAVLIAALSGGLGDTGLTPERIAALNPRLDPATVAKVLEVAGAPAVSRRPAPSPDGFTLPGQPALQALLREQVLDVLHRPQEYARLGVPSPAGILLAGPPGCGKSFAAARLATFLGWPLHEISVSGVGSMWLHETPRRLAEAFAKAAAEAPAVVLLEELDALGKSRAGGFGPTAEEVNTLLRLVEQAPGRRLLVLGTTNRPDAIDPALRRRGRFDHVIVMDHADEQGTAAMLRALLDGRPHAPTLDVAAAARRLARRPASDAVWVVNEAARLAVRSNQDAINDLLLARALHALPP